MSLAHSPRIVTSGLVLAVDGANTRSYPGTGTTWSDLSGNNNTGTLVSSPTYNTSNGGTLVFNGSSQNINITDSTSLRVTDTFTISAWVYAVDLSGRYGIFSTRYNNTAGSWQLEIGTANGGTGRVAVTGVGTWIWESVDSVVTSTTWYHICFVKPNNATVGGSMYINGTLLIPLQTTAYTIINNSDIKTIGNGTSNGQFFPGGIANVTLYNRALTADEVAQNFNALQARPLQNITVITLPPRIQLLSGTTYDATNCGAVVSIDALTTEPLYSILPTAGFLRYTIAKSTGNQTITVAYLRSGTTISQSAFSTLGLALSYSTAVSSILFYVNDDHDSLFMDADGAGVISRTNTYSFTSNWDKFRGTTEVITNSTLNSVVLYPSFVAASSTIVSFPKTTSGVWINLSAGTYKVNNLTVQTMPAAMLALGTGAPANFLYTISDGVNQFIAGRWGSATAALCTVDLTTGIISATAITYTITPTQTNAAEEDAVGTQLFAVDGSVSFLFNTAFYYGGIRPWKDLGGSPVSITGKTLFLAGNSTQSDMDIFGSIDASDRYVWFADWGHDNGGLFNVGNDSQLGVRKTNIIHISDSYTN